MAMQPKHFWPVAEHLQRCNHPIYVDSFNDGSVYVTLASGEPLCNEADSQPVNLHTVRAALLLLEARNLHRFEIRTEGQCRNPPCRPRSG